MTVRCEVCGRFDARYVCQSCGARVCPLCLNPYTGLCPNCAKVEGAKLVKVKAGLPVGFKLMIAGFIAAFIGIFIIMLAAVLTGAADISFVVLLLPIPIGLAAGPHGWLLLIIALIVAAVFLALILLIFRKPGV